MDFPSYVKLVDVGPRDGLQNEEKHVPTKVKIGLINRLTAAGLSAIETGAFVSPKWVPQMADTPAVFSGISKKSGVKYMTLTPNVQGLDLAQKSGCTEVAVFAAASESFSKANINCTISESLERFQAVVERALDAGIQVRAYISCVLGCPYEGQVDPLKVTQIASELVRMGCYEISLGDTIGVGTPGRVQDLLSSVLNEVKASNLAVHFHDTYGQALTNIFVALINGISVIDTSVSGLGGCPYAKGSSGNVSTEDVLYMLDGLGVETGVNMRKLLVASEYIANFLGRNPSSKTANAIRNKNLK